VHRLTPFSFRVLDVGVVLDLMIHDIDLVLELARGRVRRVDAVGGAIVGTTEDICNARITFDDGCVANLTASRLAMKTMRKVRIFSPQGYISLDFDRNYALLIGKSPEFSLEKLDVEALKRSSMDDIRALMLDKFFTVREMDLEGEEPLKAELKSFVECVRTGAEPVVPGDDGIRSLETAERILRAVRAHHW
jgi:predicted dehydrogenase